jgi:ribosomal protein S18 acetylase RimI-like enzyme
LEVSKSLEEKYDRAYRITEDTLCLFGAYFRDHLVGTLAAVLYEEDKSIGLFGLAVLPAARNQGVGRTLLREAVEHARAIQAFHSSRPRPPTLVALCDSAQENERLLLNLGFRRAEIRPIYGGLPALEAEGRERLRRLQWRIAP